MFNAAPPPGSLPPVSYGKPYPPPSGADSSFPLSSVTSNPKGGVGGGSYFDRHTTTSTAPPPPHIGDHSDGSNEASCSSSGNSNEIGGSNDNDCNTGFFDRASNFPPASQESHKGDIDNMIAMTSGWRERCLGDSQLFSSYKRERGNSGCLIVDRTRAAAAGAGAAYHHGSSFLDSNANANSQNDSSNKSCSNIGISSRVAMPTPPKSEYSTSSSMLNSNNNMSKHSENAIIPALKRQLTSNSRAPLDFDTLLEETLKQEQEQQQQHSTNIDSSNDSTGGAPYSYESSSNMVDSMSGLSGALLQPSNNDEARRPRPAVRPFLRKGARNPRSVIPPPSPAAVTVTAAAPAAARNATRLPSSTAARKRSTSTTNIARIDASNNSAAITKPSSNTLMPQRSIPISTVKPTTGARRNTIGGALPTTTGATEGVEEEGVKPVCTGVINNQRRNQTKASQMKPAAAAASKNNDEEDAAYTTQKRKPPIFRNTVMEKAPAFPPVDLLDTDRQLASWNENTDDSNEEGVGDDNANRIRKKQPNTAASRALFKLPSPKSALLGNTGFTGSYGLMKRKEYGLSSRTQQHHQANSSKEEFKNNANSSSNVLESLLLQTTQDTQDTLNITDDTVHALAAQAQARIAMVDEEINRLRRLQETLTAKENAFERERAKWIAERDQQRLSIAAEREAMFSEIESEKQELRRQKKQFKHEINAYEEQRSGRRDIEEKYCALKISYAQLQEDFSAKEGRYKALLEKLSDKVFTLEKKNRLLLDTVQQLESSNKRSAAGRAANKSRHTRAASLSNSQPPHEANASIFTTTHRKKQQQDDDEGHGFASSTLASRRQRSRCSRTSADMAGGLGGRSLSPQMVGRGSRQRRGGMVDGSISDIAVGGGRRVVRAEETTSSDSDSDSDTCERAPSDHSVEAGNAGHKAKGAVGVSSAAAAAAAALATRRTSLGNESIPDEELVEEINIRKAKCKTTANASRSRCASMDRNNKRQQGGANQENNKTHTDNGIVGGGGASAAVEEKDPLPISSFIDILNFDIKEQWKPVEMALQQLSSNSDGSSDILKRSRPSVLGRSGTNTATDGREEILYKDGHREVIYVNGLRKLLYPSGWIFIFFTNGDIRATHPLNTTYYYYNEHQIYTITTPDKKVFNSFSDGQVDCHFPNGVVQVRFPNRFLKQIDADGKTEHIQKY